MNQETNIGIMEKTRSRKTENEKGEKQVGIKKYDEWKWTKEKKVNWDSKRMSGGMNKYNKRVTKANACMRKVYEG